MPSIFQNMTFIFRNLPSTFQNMQNTDFYFEICTLYFETFSMEHCAPCTVLSITFDIELRIEICLNCNNLDFEGFDLI